LADAEARCAAAGEKWTEPRRRTFELLVSSGQAMKAYDLIAVYQDGPAVAKPPTIYRALEFLERLGLVHRVESQNAYTACTAAPGAHSAAFLSCECCGATTELVDLDLGGLAEAGAKVGFETASTVVEMRGRCRFCADSEA
jgi:Fur family zinc uptake transcriptional regulator